MGGAEGVSVGGWVLKRREAGRLTGVDAGKGRGGEGRRRDGVRGESKRDRGYMNRGGMRRKQRKMDTGREEASKREQSGREGGLDGKGRENGGKQWDKRGRMGTNGVSRSKKKRGERTGRL